MLNKNFVHILNYFKINKATHKTIHGGTHRSKMKNPCWQQLSISKSLLRKVRRSKKTYHILELPRIQLWSLLKKRFNLICLATEIENITNWHPVPVHKRLRWLFSFSFFCWSFKGIDESLPCLFWNLLWYFK